MNQKYPLLTSSIKIGNQVFRNRMFSAPMGATDITAEGALGPRSQGFYELRARGGAAVVTVSEVIVHPGTDCSNRLHINLVSPGMLGSYTFVADAISRHGAVPSIEFSHFGQFAGKYMEDEATAGVKYYGPVDCVRPDGKLVTGLTHEKINEIVAAYGRCAALVKRAGFKMIMIHGGHGWLINQFLSPYYNHRTDEYGGTTENRTRLAIEILKAIRENVGPGFPIEFRMSGSECFEGGYDIDEGVRIAKYLEDYIDLFHVSAGSYQDGFYTTHPSMFAPHGVNVYLAAEIKKHVAKPVATIGAINDPEMMERILAEGKADVIYMARALLADPELPNKVLAGKEAEIVRCLRCFTCMAERPVTQTRRCTVNPLIGRENEGADLCPALIKKKVLVAGGGVAGLEAAIVAARRGHRVVLCEKSDAVGGIMKSEQAIPFKHEMYQLGLSLERQAVDAGVEIRLNTAVNEAYVEQEKPDALILAVGSTPVIPTIPGIEGENVIPVTEYYRRKDEVAGEVVVLGGGLAGCECAIHLAQDGKKVHLVEMGHTLAPDCNVKHRPILMRKLNELVDIHTGCTGREVTGSGIACSNDKLEMRLIPGDTIILAAGCQANRADVDALYRSAPFVRVIGDCDRPANITKAIYEGYHAGKDV